MMEMIEQILDNQVRPALRAHNGDVKVQAFHDGVLIIKLLGQCASCPSALSTTEDLIRAEIIAALPEVKDVEVDNGVGPELLSMARKILNHEIGVR